MALLSVPVIDIEPFRRGGDSEKAAVAERVAEAICSSGVRLRWVSRWRTFQSGFDNLTLMR